MFTFAMSGQDTEHVFLARTTPPHLQIPKHRTGIETTEMQVILAWMWKGQLIGESVPFRGDYSDSCASYILVP